MTSLADRRLLNGPILCAELAKQTHQISIHKDIFISQANAQKTASRANAKYKPLRPLVPYLCEHCGWWHNGRLPLGVADTHQQFVMIGATGEILQSSSYVKKPLAEESELLVQQSPIRFTTGVRNELQEICTAISQPFELQNSGWASVVNIGPEYWAALNNLHLPDQHQVVLRVEQTSPLLARFWPVLPPYYAIWQHENVVSSASL